MPTFTLEKDGVSHQFNYEGDTPPTAQDADAAWAAWTAAGRPGNAAVQDTPSAPTSPGIGELRRREGMGEIAVGQPVAAPSMLERFVGGMAGADAAGTGMAIPPTTDFGTVQRTAEAQGALRALRDYAPYVAGAAIEAPLAGSLLYRTTVQGFKSGLAATGTSEGTSVLLGEKEASQAVKDSVIPVALSTIGGPILAGAGKAIGAAYTGAKNLITSAAAGVESKPLGAAAAELLRPVELSPEQLTALRSRELIQSATGHQIPLGLVDVLGTKKVVGELAQQAGDLSPETLSAASQAAFHAAANTPSSGRTLEEVSKAAYDILNTQKTGLGAPALKAVEDYSRQAIQAVNNAEDAVTGVAKSVFTGRPLKYIGDSLKDLGKSAMDSAKAVWDAKYALRNSNPLWTTVKPKLSEVARIAKDEGLNFIQDETGKLSVIGGPSGARTAITAAGHLQDAHNYVDMMVSKGYGRKVIEANVAQHGVPDTYVDKQYTLEQAANLITELNQGLKSPGFLPGIEDRVKLKLIDAVKKSVNEAITPHPELVALNKDAVETYAQNIPRFRSPMSEGIISKVGEGGGSSGEEIVRMMTGPDAGTNFEQLMKLMGKGATAGNDFSGQASDLVREAVLSKAASKGTDVTGKINIGTMLGTVQDLAEPVRKQLFPDMSKVEEALLREVKLKNFNYSTADAQKLLDHVNLNPADVQKALQGDAAPLIASAKNAISVETATRQTLQKMGLDQLKEQSAFNLQTWITDPMNKAKVANTITQLERVNPALAQETKAVFLQNLIDESSVGGVFKPEKFAELTRKTMLPTGPLAPGNAPGKYSDSLETVFGPKKAEIISALSDTIGSLKTTADATAKNEPLFRSLSKALLYGIGASFFTSSKYGFAVAMNSLQTAAAPIKTKILSNLLSSDELRREAMKPIGPASLKAIETAVRATAASIGAEYGKNSPMYRQVQGIEQSIQPNSERYQAPLR
jgi:hypothetical protein